MFTPQLSEADYQKRINDRDIVKLAKQTARDWPLIARHLNHAAHDDLAFELNTQTLEDAIAGMPNDREKMIQVLLRWREMHRDHKWGMLWSTLHECGYGAAANLVLQPSQPTTRKLH